MLGTELRKAIEFVVQKLHQDPNPNKATWPMTEEEIVDKFWTEFADFCNRRGVFGDPARWRGSHACAGKSHRWHEAYSLDMTTVLGFVACCVTSKNAGIGMCERNWGDVKEIKSGKRAGLSGDSTEKRALVYTTARAKEGRLRTLSRENKEEENVEFEDQDLAFNEDLEKVGVVARDLKRLMKKLVFQCWLTDKEKNGRRRRILYARRSF